MPADQRITLEQGKEQLQKLFDMMKKSDRDQLLAHAISKYMGLEMGDCSSSDDDENYDADNANWLDDPATMLRVIAKEIRNRVPFDAVLPSENIVPPKKGVNADCDPEVSLHIDGFLYDEDDVDELEREGKIQRYYCKDCGSKNTTHLIFISHSLSREALYHIFNTLLPTLDGKTVLDVGSRLGAVLYGAYAYTDATKIIGVEMNKDLCDLQNDIVNKYKMTERIEVINKRIEDCVDVLSKADVIVLNNVFEFYLSEEEQTAVWKFLKANIKKGTYLVTVPSVEVALSTLKTGIEIEKWLEETSSSKEVDRTVNDNEKPDEFDMAEIHCYKVL